MQATHLHLRRTRVPERCRPSPDCSYDRGIGLHLCNVRSGNCHYRGPVFILDATGRRFECRKVEAAEE